MDLRFINVYHTVHLHVVTFQLMYNATKKITTALLLWYTPKTSRKKNYSHFRLLDRIHQIHTFMRTSLSDFPKASWDQHRWVGYLSDIHYQSKVWTNLFIFTVYIGDTSVVLCRDQLVTKPCLTAVRIYGVARTNQPSKEKQQATTTLTTQSYSVCKIAKTLNVSPGTVKIIVRKGTSAAKDKFICISRWTAPQIRVLSCRRRFDGVGMLCWWHCWGFVQTCRSVEPPWLPWQQHAILAGLSLVGRSFILQQEPWPQTHLWYEWGLFYKEGECWSAASDDLASTVTWPKLSQDSLGWDGHQSKGKGAKKFSVSLGNPFKTVENPF